MSDDNVRASCHGDAWSRFYENRWSVANGRDADRIGEPNSDRANGDPNGRALGHSADRNGNARPNVNDGDGNRDLILLPDGLRRFAAAWAADAVGAG